MIAEVFLATALLQQWNQSLVPLNFSEIGMSWKSDALYVLYNEKTTAAWTILDVTDAILESGRGYFAHQPRIIADIESSQHKLRELGSFSINSLIVVIMNGTGDPVWKKADEMMKHLKEAAVVFLQATSIANCRKQFFENLWRQQYRRVLVATMDKRELFTMKPYPKLAAINVTHRGVNEYFPRLVNWNLQGYTLNVPVQMDVPNMFWHYDHKIGSIRLDGIGGRIFYYFMRALNVKLNIYPLYVNGSNALNMVHIENMILNGDLEISPHWCTTSEPKDIAYSYPYMSTPRCIILPMDCVTDSAFFPFQWAMWAMIFAFLVISEIIGHILLKQPWHWLHISKWQRLRFPGTITFYAICLLMGIPVPSRTLFNIQNTPRHSFVRTLFTYATVTVSGFCFSQMLSTYMTSRLAAFVTSNPSITSQQILEMGTLIMITTSDAKYLAAPDNLGIKFNKKFYLTTYEEFHQNRLSLNASFMYPVSLDRWKIVRAQQSYLIYKRFLLSTVCYGHYPLQYQLRYDSYFLSYLNRFILYILESGLFLAWERRVIRKAVELRHMRYFKDSRQLAFLRKKKKFSKILRNLLLSFYGTGVVLSFVAFLMELLVHKYWERQRTKMRKLTGKPILKITGLKSEQLRKA